MFPFEISGWALFVHDLSPHPHIHTISSINFMQQKKHLCNRRHRKLQHLREGDVASVVGETSPNSKLWIEGREAHVEPLIRGPHFHAERAGETILRMVILPTHTLISSAAPFSFLHSSSHKT